jgi:hypothetical protein
MFMSSMTSKYHINVFQASHQHQIIITLVNLAKDPTILQKKASSRSLMFKFFTSFDYTPAHDTAHIHLSSCLHMSVNHMFSEKAINHKQKNKSSHRNQTSRKNEEIKEGDRSECDDELLSSIPYHYILKKYSISLDMPYIVKVIKYLRKQSSKKYLFRPIFS